VFGERDSRFFQLFESAAANVANGAKVLESIVTAPSLKEQKAVELEEIEHIGDSLTHDIIAELNRAFITPIDREDIFLLAKELDNIVDSIETAGYRFVMFNIDEADAAAEELAHLITTSAGELISIMQVLRKPKNIVADNKEVVEINRIEDEGDKVYRRAVRGLYSGAIETLKVIKWREIYDHLEDTLDALEDVANIVEGIAMKHS
jgi:predicted phosphate transport protein (TIGR00153 family)